MRTIRSFSILVLTVALVQPVFADPPATPPPAGGEKAGEKTPAPG
jgi:hypothetical protein